MLRNTMIALAASTALAAPAMAQEMTIPEVATEAGDFSTLLAAVEAAGLAETLMGEGPFTVFAPTDEAFAALPEGTVEGLLEDIPALTAILTYHVVPGEYMAEDLSENPELETVNGASLTINAGDIVQVNGAQVIAPNVDASNGVIHAIDAVLIP